VPEKPSLHLNIPFEVRFTYLGGWKIRSGNSSRKGRSVTKGKRPMKGMGKSSAKLLLKMRGQWKRLPQFFILPK